MESKGVNGHPLPALPVMPGWPVCVPRMGRWTGTDCRASANGKTRLGTRGHTNSPARAVTAKLQACSWQTHPSPPFFSLRLAGETFYATEALINLKLCHFKFVLLREIVTPEILLSFWSLHLQIQKLKKKKKKLTTGSWGISMAKVWSYSFDGLRLLKCNTGEPLIQQFL